MLVDGAIHTKKTPPSSLKAQIIDKDIRISQLEARVSTLEAEMSRLRKLSIDNRILINRNQTLSSTDISLKSLKRKAETTLQDELAKKHKRVKRLESERRRKQNSRNAELSSMEDTLDDKSAQITLLEQDLAAARTRIDSGDVTLLSLQPSLKDKQTTLTAIRNRLYAPQKQTKRAQESLNQIRKGYTHLRTWRPTEDGQYSTAAQELAPDLIHAGCAAGKVEFAIRSCARTFGIEIRGRVMGRCTVSRGIDEGGKYGEIQLAREILDSPGMVSLPNFASLIVSSLC
jgi:chromosome segregation ATPase